VAPDNSQPEAQTNQVQPQAQQQVRLNDVNLRKVSISTRDLLIHKSDGSEDFEFNPDMLQFVRAVKDKYRIYLLTRISESNSKDEVNEEDFLSSQKA